MPTNIDPRIVKYLPWLDIGCFVLAAVGLVLVFLGLQNADAARLQFGITITAIAMPVGIASQIAAWYLKRKKS